MRHDAPSYVERKADQELLTALSRGEFCHVLTARQMGKSSLMLRTGATLRAMGVTCAVLDLTAIGQNLTAEQWYAGLIVQIGDRLGLEDDLIAYWRSQPLLGPMQKWVKTIRNAVLTRFRGPLVIFVDEIDAVRSLSFSSDEFFAGIRECYNLRDDDPEMRRLTFCLLGVAGVSDLIHDARTTPFNIGRRIDLNDFTDEEASSLRDGLGKGEAQNRNLLKRILYWTGGHPYLTQRVCRAAAEGPSVSDARDIDRIIGELFFVKRASDTDDNLAFVRAALLRSQTDLSSLLLLYARIRNGKSVPNHETNPLLSTLTLSGIARWDQDRPRVRNRIYERAFDGAWIKAHMPGSEIRRQREAYLRGVMRAVLISALILTAVSVLAFIAYRQKNLATEEAILRRRLSYDARVNLAHQELENGQINRVEELLADTSPLPGEEDLRGFEWFTLWSASHKEIFNLKGSDPIGAVAFLGSDQALAIAESQHATGTCVIKFCDPVKNGNEHAPFVTVPVSNGFDVVAFSTDRQSVVADGPNYSFNLWDVRSGLNLGTFNGHSTTITALALSRDMASVASADQNGIVKVWDVATRKEKLARTIPRERGYAPEGTRWVRGIDISPDGRLIAITNGTAQVHILNVDNGTFERPYEGVDARLVRAKFLPRGNILVATGDNGRLYIWDRATKRILANKEGHTNEITSFETSPDGRKLATGSLDRTILLWDTATWNELDIIKGHGSEVTTLDWSPSGKALASGGRDGAVKIWDLSLNSIPILPKEKVASYYASAFTPSNELLVIGRSRDLRTKVWNLSTGQTISEAGKTGETMLCAAFSPDTTKFAFGGMDNVVTIAETASGNPISTLRGNSPFYGVSFSPDGEFVVTGDKDGAVKIWDASNGSEFKSFTSSVSYFRSSFSPDGRLLGTSTRNGAVLLWDIATGSEIRSFIGHSDRVRVIAFSPDGQRLATGGKDNTIRVWDVSTGKEVTLLARYDSIERAVFTSDGKRLVTGGLDGSIKIWDLIAAQPVATLKRHGGEVTSITFSRDGSALVVCGQDGSITQWQGGRDSRPGDRR